MQFSIRPHDPVEEELDQDYDRSQPAKLKINKNQSEFIDKCKYIIKKTPTGTSLPIVFDPRSVTERPINPYIDLPDIQKYGYIKKVIAMIPHLNFPGINLRCKDSNCNCILKPKNFGSNTRLCHGFHEDLYIITYIYCCTGCKSMYCSSVLKFDDYANNQYQIYLNRR